VQRSAVQGLFVIAGIVQIVVGALYGSPYLVPIGVGLIIFGIIDRVVAGRRRG